MSEPQTMHFPFDRVRRRSLQVAAVGVILSAIIGFISPREFYRAWLVSWIFWGGLTFGGLGLLMLYFITGGRWGFVIRRIVEAAAATMPLTFLLFIPLLFGLHDLYHWSDPKAAHDPHIMAKASYLNVNAFYVRTAIYFVIWLALAFFLGRMARRNGYNAPGITGNGARRLSIAGMLLYFLTMSFAAIDWIMSIDPEWFSTIFGALVIISQVLGAIAFAIVMLTLLADRPPLRDALSPQALNDLGNLLLAFLLLWIYMLFSQYLLIWTGDLMEEIPWVLNRTHGGWQAIGVTLIFISFFLPFVVLLFRAVKRLPQRLLAVAAFIFCMRYLFVVWLVTPSFHPRLYFHWLDAATMLAIGGLWVAFFLHCLSGRALLPRHDPWFKVIPIEEAPHHG